MISNDSKDFYFSNLFLDLLEQGKFFLSNLGFSISLDSLSQPTEKIKLVKSTGLVANVTIKKNQEKKEKKIATAITDVIHVIQWNGEHNHPLH
jgi:hypothetical protein